MRSNVFSIVIVRSLTIGFTAGADCGPLCEEWRACFLSLSLSLVCVCVSVSCPSFFSLVCVCWFVCVRRSSVL